MKRIFSLVLAILMICAVFTGCTKESPEQAPTSEIQTETNPQDSATETKPGDIENVNKNPTEPTKSEEELLKEKEDLYRQYMSEIKIELLSVDANLDFDKHFFKNGYYVDDKYGGVGTVITIGIEYPSKEAFNALSRFDIAGETATDPDNANKEAFQYKETYATEDEMYRVIMFTVQGNVDTSKAHVRIGTKMDNVFEERKFDNDGVPVGYATAIEKYSTEDNNMGLSSGIIKLKDRHYKVVRRHMSDSDCYWVDENDPSKGCCISIDRELALLPLEGGEMRTLNTEDVDMLISDSSLIMKGAEFTVKVDRANAFGGADPIHTVIYSTAKVRVDKVVKDPEYDWPDYDAYTTEMKELDSSFAGVIFKIDNSDGEMELQMIPKD